MLIQVSQVIHLAWLKAGVVGAPICSYNRLVHSSLFNILMFMVMAQMYGTAAAD